MDTTSLSRTDFETFDFKVFRVWPWPLTSKGPLRSKICIPFWSCFFIIIFNVINNIISCRLAGNHFTEPHLIHLHIFLTGLIILLTFFDIFIKLTRVQAKIKKYVPEHFDSMTDMNTNGECLGRVNSEWRQRRKLLPIWRHCLQGNEQCCHIQSVRPLLSPFQCFAWTHGISRRYLHSGWISLADTQSEPTVSSTGRLLWWECKHMQTKEIAMTVVIQFLLCFLQRVPLVWVYEVNPEWRVSWVCDVYVLDMTYVLDKTCVLIMTCVLSMTCVLTPKYDVCLEDVCSDSWIWRFSPVWRMSWIWRVPTCLWTSLLTNRAYV